MGADDLKPRSIEDVLDDETREQLDEAREDDLADEEGSDDIDDDLDVCAHGLGFDVRCEDCEGF